VGAQRWLLFEDVRRSPMRSPVVSSSRAYSCAQTLNLRKNLICNCCQHFARSSDGHFMHPLHAGAYAVYSNIF